jgi:hypothetical protein
MRGQERIELKRRIGKLKRARKIASTINSVNQQNTKIKPKKVKNNQDETQSGKKAVETQETVNTSQS